MIEHGAFVELRREARTLAGTLVSYGDVSGPVINARSGRIVRERVDAGSFRLPAASYLNIEHQPSRVISQAVHFDDSAERLEVRAELDGSKDADEALRLVDAGELTGLSAEFVTLADRELSGLRVIRDAELKGVAAVRSPGYPSTLERRQAIGTMRSFTPLQEALYCQCHRGEAGQHMVSFSEDAMTKALARIRESDADLIAHSGDTKTGYLASLNAGTLRINPRRGQMDVDVDLPPTPTGETVRTLLREGAPILARPLFDTQESRFELRDGVAFYTDLFLTSILVGATGNSEGWTPAVLAAAGRRRRRAVT